LYNKIWREAIEKRPIDRISYKKSGNQSAKDIFLIERKNCKGVIQKEKRKFLNRMLEEAEKDHLQGKLRNFFKTFNWTV